MGRQKNRSHLTNIFGYLVDMEKFEDLQETMPNGCIHYHGLNHRQGYQFIGCIREHDDKRMHITAHRLAMRIKLGRDIGIKEQVIHTCSNVRCVNPNHLILGDTKKRSEVMRANGRQNNRRHSPQEYQPQRTRQYKYTPEEMLWIRSHTTREFVEKFGIDSYKAAAIRNGIIKGYKWLDNYKK